MTKYLILCGGIGSRLHCSLFPKPLTLIKGIPLIYHVLDSLEVSNLTFIVNPYLKSYNFEELVRKYITKPKNLTFWYINYMTRGSLETLYHYLSHNPTQEQIVILDNDNLYYLFENIKLIKNGLLYIKTKNQSSNYSFIKHNEQEQVIAISEKEKISDNACIGYYLSDPHLLLDLIKNIVTSTPPNKEVYISSLFKALLDRDEILTSFHLSKGMILGTEEDIAEASDLKMNRQPKVVYDLDNTLITTDSEPIERNINFLKYLKDQGWFIIIHTARGMKNNDLSLAKKQLVIDTLTKLSIPYDELIFGKPYGDIYIDDKAHNPYDDYFYKKLGFNYSHNLFQIPNMNKDNIIFRSSYESITKQAKGDIRGEINYYHFANRHQLEYFPKLLSTEGNSLNIEFVSGPTFSELYLEGLLGLDLLELLLDTVDRLHNSKISDNIIIEKYDFVQFYSSKFYARTKLYETEKWYKRSIMKQLEEWLLSYLTHDIEVTNMIHGDLWFPNIILSKGKIKFIDMRGLIGEVCTVKGDKLYDYAKLYQSLIGMDFIINSKPLSPNRSLIDYFEKRYNQYMPTIRAMTAYTIYCSLYSWKVNHALLFDMINKLLMVKD